MKNEESKKPPSWFEAVECGQGKTNYAILPIQLLLDNNVSKTGMQVFAALATHAHPVTGLCGRFSRGEYHTPSYARLGAIVGLCVRSVHTGIKNLEAAGWIVKKKRRYDNTYLFWIGMPANLQLVNSNGNFSKVPESWSNAKILENVAENQEAEMGLLMEEYRRNDDSIDMDIVFAAKESGSLKNKKTKPSTEVAKTVLKSKKEATRDAVVDIFKYKETGKKSHSDDHMSSLGLSYGMDLEELWEDYPDIAENIEY